MSNIHNKPIIVKRLRENLIVYVECILLARSRAEHYSTA